MEIYNPSGNKCICDPEQLDIVLEAGWTKEKPKEKPVFLAEEVKTEEKVEEAKAPVKKRRTPIKRKAK